MNILFVSIGKQDDIREALESIGSVFTYDWTGARPDVFNNTIHQYFDSVKPGLVFLQIQHPDMLDLELARYMSGHSFVVNWTGDVRSPLPQWYKDLGAVIQLSLFSNMNDVREMNALGLPARYLQIGFPDKIFTPKGKKIDNHPPIVFMGSNYPKAFPLSDYRYEMVKFLQHTYGDQFAVYGNGWGENNIKNIANQYEEAAIYRSCKVAINLSHFDYERYSSDRIFRIMGAGALCLSHDYNGIGYDFERNYDLWAWQNHYDLIKCIDSALNNESLVRPVADRGCEHVHTNHTWLNRIAQLKNMIKIHS